MQVATITQWLKQPGDSIVAGEALYSMETDKVNQEVNATVSGRLVEILAPAGAEVPVGGATCVVDAATKS